MKRLPFSLVTDVQLRRHSLLAYFFCRFGKTVLHASTGTFWGYMVHFKKIKSSSLNNQRMFQLCFETKIVEVVENAFNVYFGTFWEKYFFEKLIVLLICSDKEQKHFGFCRKCFSWDFATAFYVLIGEGLGKTLFVRKLDVFVLPQYDGKSIGFCRNYLGWVVKPAFDLSIGTLWS